jgi:predicted Ser/Thr protein kinase
VETELNVMEPESTCPKCGSPLVGEGAASICPKCVATMILGRTVQYFGDYELLEEIGRGGMGVVYRARQCSLNRPVALKMMIQGGFASPEFVRRFQNEAESAASLQHPNIVAIYEVGLIDGLHYFSMDYIDGPSLAEVVQEGPLPADRAARYVELVAEAIHYAHQRGILHRDLKPSNVLIDPFDLPRVTDFGLAKRLDHDLGPTLTGEVLGSPGYMPPEQAAGRHALVSVTSDVYSLGAILYHLLAGQAPFTDENVARIYERVQKEEVVSPRALNPGIPRELETICLKCLRKEPSQRYASAAELAADLKRWQTGERIAARSLAVGGELLRWCGAHRRKAFAAVALCLVAVGIGFGGWRLMSTASNRALSADGVWTLLRSQFSTSNATPSAPKYVAVSPQPSLGPGQRWTNSLGMIFVPVAGTSVRFSIWDTRVQDFQAFVAATFRPSWTRPSFEQGPTHPAVMLDWNEARRFCAWLTEKERLAGTLEPNQEYRLPTDLEWSAAVGLENEVGDTPQKRDRKVTNVFPWAGAQWPPSWGVGNYSPQMNVDAYDSTSPAGSFGANEFGLYDMGGNVMQWCEDFYDGQGTNCVARGAAFNTLRRDLLQSSARYAFRPVRRSPNIGFRCVLAPVGVSKSGVPSIEATTTAVSRPPAPGMVAAPPSGETPKTLQQQTSATSTATPASATNLVGADVTVSCSDGVRVLPLEVGQIRVSNATAVWTIGSVSPELAGWQFVSVTQHKLNAYDIRVNQDGILYVFGGGRAEAAQDIFAEIEVGKWEDARGAIRDSKFNFSFCFRRKVIAGETIRIQGKEIQIAAKHILLGSVPRSASRAK